MFTSEGLLPTGTGDYEMTLEELLASPLVENPSVTNPHWDGKWRKYLVEQLAILAGQLWTVGISEIFINGSFVEDRDHPNDIDGYFHCDLKRLASGDLARELNLLDPYKIWTWDPTSRRPYRGYTKRQLPMWHQYRVELYPHYGQMCGIEDAHGNELEFPAAFRRSKRGDLAKGIIKLIR